MPVRASLHVPPRLFFLAALLLCLPRLAAAQALQCQTGDPEVLQVKFIGNRLVGADSLSRAIVTAPSSWARRKLGLPLGRKRCLDSLELKRDVIRLRLFYRQRGYYRTAVDPSQQTLGPHAVGVVFNIAEGPPVIIDSLAIAGLDTARNGKRLMQFLLPFKGGVFNRLLLAQAIDTVVDRLRNDGYARAQEPLRNTFVDTTNHATVELTFLPGRIYRIGKIIFDIRPNRPDTTVRIAPSTVRKLLAFQTGDLYRQRDILTSQRDLYQLETYSHVSLGIAPDSLDSPTDSLLTMVAQLSEAKMHSIRLGAGWATLDCFRAQGRFVDRDFLGGARRLELSARLSKIGVGKPLDGFPGLCTGNVRRDVFSRKLNYSVSATFRPPALFGMRYVPSLTIYSQRQSEFNAFLRYTPVGGIASITRDVAPRTPLTLSYQIEYGRTEADEAIFCQVFNVCNLADIARLQDNHSLRVASLSLVRDRSDNPLNPTTGSQMRAEFRSGATAVGAETPEGQKSHLRFNKLLGEASVYRPIGTSSVLAAHLQLGAVLDGWSLHGASHFVPPEERLYAGGPNSVRGYNQNQLGSVVYVVDTFAISADSAGATRYEATPANSTVERFSPTGGNTLLVGNLELRTPSPVLHDIAHLALFVDVGDIWNRGREAASFGDIKVTPGVGVRVASPVGPLRLDVGYNRYSQPAGSAYYVGTLSPDQPRVLRCVSPGNTFDEGITTSGSDCPTTYAPPQSNTFLSRLTFHFSIGQAF
ncbi:MAG TPA: BamA/TamA family outer membrane protein [Gemmatimonadaceae bacterium]|nr:BamA/TamA family outer membrane protein [Gemmatimonadaceae bacterium]